MLFNQLPAENQNYYKDLLIQQIDRSEKYFDQFSFAGFRNLFLLNGGGAVAILTFKGVHFSLTKDLGWGNGILAWFLGGLLLAVVVNAIEFFRFLHHSTRWRDRAREFFENKMDHEAINQFFREKDTARWISIVTGVLSAVCFVIGVIASVLNFY